MNGLTTLLSLLSDPAPWMRLAALRQLADWGSRSKHANPRAVPAVVGCLRDADLMIREQAARTLYQLHPDDEAIFDALLAALADPVASVRAWVAKALSHFEKDAERQPRLVAALRPLCHDPDDTVRATVVWRLAECVPHLPTLLPELRHTLQSDDPWVIRSTADALSKVGGESIAWALPWLLAIFDAAQVDRQEVVAAIGSIGPSATDALPRLRQLIRSDADDMAWVNAFEALGHISRHPEDATLSAEFGRDAPHLLTNAIHEEDTETHARVEVALAAIGEAVVPLVVPLLRHRGPNVRAVAVSILKEIGPPAASAVTDLLPLLDESEWPVPQRAAEAIAAIGVRDPALIAPLIARLRTGGEPIWQAIAGIGALAVPALIDALNNGNARVRAGAAQTLRVIGEPVRAAVLHLVPLFDDPDEDVRAAAIVAVGHIGGPDALASVPRLLHIFAEGETYYEQASDTVAAAEALGLMGQAGHPAIPKLIDMAGNWNRWVHRAARETLARFGRAALPEAQRRAEKGSVESGEVFVLRQFGLEALPWLVMAAPGAGDSRDDRNDDGETPWGDIVDALVNLGEPGIAALWDLTRHTNAETRAKAIESIGYSQAVGDVQSLLPTLRDADADVRRAALAAIAERCSDQRVTVPMLLRALSDPDEDVRNKAAELLDSRDLVLTDFVDEIVEALATAGRTGQHYLFSVLSGLGDRGEAALSARLTDARPEIRRAAVGILASQNPPPESLLPTLMATAADANAGTRGEAYAMLSRYPNQLRKVGKALLADLRGGDWGQVRTAAVYLGQCRYAPARAVPALFEAARTDTSSRENAKTTLRHLRGGES